MRKTTARHIALLGTLLLLSVTALALGRRIQQQKQPQPYQNSFRADHTRPAPPPYKNSFPVSHSKPLAAPPQNSSPAAHSRPAPGPASPAPYHGSFPVTHTSPIPATASPASRPKSSAERLHNALLSLPPLPFNPTTIVIDPGHGGADNGSRISDTIVEKDVTLAFAFRLRSLLTARGFNVVLTREDDKAANTTPPFAPLTLDDRAGIANHERPSACIFLHATSSGTGVHLYTSELTPTSGELPAAPWLTLQAAWVQHSQHLASRIADALSRSRIPLVNGSASIRPVDSATCPALVFELAPRTDDAGSINDSSYQQSIALATANALILWKNSVQAPPRLTPAAPEPTPEALP